MKINPVPMSGIRRQLIILNNMWNCKVRYRQHRSASLIQTATCFATGFHPQ